MKKLLLLSFIILSLISCKSNDSNDKPNSPTSPQSQDQSQNLDQLKLKDIALVYYVYGGDFISDYRCVKACSINSNSDLNTQYDAIKQNPENFLKCEKFYQVNLSEVKDDTFQNMSFTASSDQFVIIKESLDYKKSLYQDPDMNIENNCDSINNATQYSNDYTYHYIVITNDVLQEYKSNSSAKWLPYVDNKTPALTSNPNITMWKDRSTGHYWTIGNDSELQSWTDAVTYCKNLNYGGFSSGWELPSLDRIKTINTTETNLDYHYIPCWWTKTEYASDKSKVYSVQSKSYKFGQSSILDKNNVCRTICVR